MRIDTNSKPPGLTHSQQFFFACWFNLSHDASLDSDRVSLSIPILVARELLNLYEFGNKFGGNVKRRDVGCELASILVKNAVLDLPHYRTLKEDLRVIDDLRVQITK